MGIGLKRYPRRPPRLSKLFGDARPFDFVTFNTRDRRHLLAHPEAHDAFFDFCEKAIEMDIAMGLKALGDRPLGGTPTVSERRDYIKCAPAER